MCRSLTDNRQCRAVRPSRRRANLRKGHARLALDDAGTQPSFRLSSLYLSHPLMNKVEKTLGG